MKLSDYKNVPLDTAACSVPLGSMGSRTKIEVKTRIASAVCLPPVAGVILSCTKIYVNMVYWDALGTRSHMTADRTHYCRCIIIVVCLRACRGAQAMQLGKSQPSLCNHTWTYFSADRWHMSTYRPNGKARELPRKPSPRPTYVKKDVIPKVLSPYAACKKHPTFVHNEHLKQ